MPRLSSCTACGSHRSGTSGRCTIVGRGVARCDETVDREAARRRIGERQQVRGLDRDDPRAAAAGRRDLEREVRRARRRRRREGREVDASRPPPAPAHGTPARAAAGELERVGQRAGARDLGVAVEERRAATVGRGIRLVLAAISGSWMRMSTVPPGGIVVVLSTTRVAASANRGSVTRRRRSRSAGRCRCAPRPGPGGRRHPTAAGRARPSTPVGERAGAGVGGAGAHAASTPARRGRRASSAGGAPTSDPDACASAHLRTVSRATVKSSSATWSISTPRPGPGRHAHVAVLEHGRLGHDVAVRRTGSTPTRRPAA